MITEKRKAGRPKSDNTIGTESATEQRATFILRKDLLKKIKLLAEAEGRRISIEGIEATVKLKIVVNNALDEYIRSYEVKYGELK